MTLAGVLGAGAPVLLALGAGQDPAPVVRVHPTSVEVGEPFRVAIELPGGGAGALAVAAPDLDPSWALLGSELEPPATLVLTVASLEPGARTLDVLPHGARAEVEVRSVLAEGEDAPRPLRGFRELPAPAAPPSRAPLLLAGAAGAVLLALLVLSFALRPRRRRRAPPAVPAAARLAALRSDELALAAALLREALDERQGATRAGLADDEWLAAAERAGLTPDALAAARAVLDAAARARWAGEPPTPWSAREALESARRALERAPAAPAGAAP